jgi:hypothetical protein
MYWNCLNRVVHFLRGQIKFLKCEQRIDIHFSWGGYDSTRNAQITFLLSSF